MTETFGMIQSLSSSLLPPKDKASNIDMNTEYEQWYEKEKKERGLQHLHRPLPCSDEHDDIASFHFEPHEESYSNTHNHNMHARMPARMPAYGSGHGAADEDLYGNHSASAPSIASPKPIVATQAIDVLKPTAPPANYPSTQPLEAAQETSMDLIIAFITQVQNSNFAYDDDHEAAVRFVSIVEDVIYDVDGDRSKWKVLKRLEISDLAKLKQLAATAERLKRR